MAEVYSNNKYTLPYKQLCHFYFDHPNKVTATDLSMDRAFI